MSFPVTATYAALLALLMIALQGLAIIARGRSGILCGDGGRMDLMLPVRRHGNFIERVPMVLVLVALAEAQGLPATWLHASGATLCLARIIQPFCASASRTCPPTRHNQGRRRKSKKKAETSSAQVQQGGMNGGSCLDRRP